MDPNNVPSPLIIEPVFTPHSRFSTSKSSWALQCGGSSCVSGEGFSGPRRLISGQIMATLLDSTACGALFVSNIVPHRLNQGSGMIQKWPVVSGPNQDCHASAGRCYRTPSPPESLPQHSPSTKPPMCQQTGLLETSTVEGNTVLCKKS